MRRSTLAAGPCLAALALAGCGTMTAKDVEVVYVERLAEVATGTWVSDPDPRNELCQRRILEVSRLADLTPRDQGDVWLMSWLTTSGTEIGDARKVVHLVPIGRAQTQLEQYRLTDPGRFTEDTTREAPVTFAELSLIGSCEVLLDSIPSGAELRSNCARRGDPGDWLAANTVAWGPASFSIRVEGFTGQTGPLSWGGCHFARPR
jgi:hypothetical protein